MEVEHKASAQRLKKLSFTQYRAFDKSQTVELKPITLLFGWNSAGKSAILRLLPIIASSISERRSLKPGSILNYDHPALRGAVFSDLSYRRESPARVQVGLEWSDVSIRYNISKLTQAEPESISNFDVISGEFSLNARSDLDGSPGEYIHAGKNGLKDKIELQGFLPYVDGCSEKRSQDFVDLARNRLIQMSESTRWLSGIRAGVPRFFEESPSVEKKISWDGSGTAEALHADWLSDGRVHENVSRWLKEATGCSLSFSHSAGTQFLGRNFVPHEVISKSGASVAVRDVGEGVAQALPVVTLCEQALQGKLGEAPTLAFEQPELHLHPRAGTQLANYIIECVSRESNAAHIIETHSENMLLSAQIAIADKRLRPEDLVVYWVREGGDGSEIVRIDFDEKGYPSQGWPQGVFREAMEQARQLAALRIEG